MGSKRGVNIVSTIPKTSVRGGRRGGGFPNYSGGSLKKGGKAQNYAVWNSGLTVLVRNKLPRAI